MIKIMNGLPDNVLGVSAEGQVTGADYENVLIPAVEEKLKANKKIRVIYHLGIDFTGIDFSAIVDDAKIGMKHLSSWEKMAVVSDNHTIKNLVKFFGYMLPAEVRIFGNNELDAAKKWVVA
jgi:hypothetical protein